MPIGDWDVAQTVAAMEPENFRYRIEFLVTPSCMKRTDFVAGTGTYSGGHRACYVQFTEPTPENDAACQEWLHVKLFVFTHGSDPLEIEHVSGLGSLDEDPVEIPDGSKLIGRAVVNIHTREMKVLLSHGSVSLPDEFRTYTVAGVYLLKRKRGGQLVVLHKC